MKVKTIFEKLEKNRILPVVVIDDSKHAEPLGKALLEGGLGVAEVTFRTDAAPDAVKILKQTYPQMLLGAGTVLNVEQVKMATDAGADFIVSPGINPKVVDYCVKNHICIIPGTCNPTNIEMALSYGIHVVKFFPAEASGGINYIKAISAPYSNVRFIPTGGINQNNLQNYLSFDRVLACGGSWMVRQDLLQSQNYEEITQLTYKAVTLAEQLKQNGEIKNK